METGEEKPKSAISSILDWMASYYKNKFIRDYSAYSIPSEYLEYLKKGKN